MTKKLIPQARKLTVVAACAFLAACGGGEGGGGGGAAEGRFQAISFKYPGGNTLLNGPTTLSATATSGLPVSFRSGTPATCTVADNQVTLVAAGECQVIASQPGGAGTDGTRWAAADDTSQLFNVLKHAQRPVTPLGVVLRAASASVTLSGKTDAGLPATYKSTTPEICTVSGTTLTVMSTGTCQLGVTAPADASYAAMAETPAFIAVSPLPPSVAQLQGMTQTVALASVDAGGNALTYASTTPAVCTVASTELRLNAKGICAVTLSKAGGASENFQVIVDPRVFAAGFDSAAKRTSQFGELNYSAGFPLAWCGGGPNPPNCNLTVTGFSATFGVDISKASNPNWDGSTKDWWSFLTAEIGAPRKKTDSGYDWLPFDVKTEDSLYMLLAINQPALDVGSSDNERGVYVRIKTNHLVKKGNDDCYVTVSAHLRPTSAAPSEYVIPFKDFAVTDKCGSPDLPQTEGWMYDWGVSAESKAAALAEIRAYGIRALQFAPGTVNLKRPTPNADGTLPSPTDAGYTLSTDITVYGLITVQ